MLKDVKRTCRKMSCSHGYKEKYNILEIVNLLLPCVVWNLTKVVFNQCAIRVCFKTLLTLTANF